MKTIPKTTELMSVVDGPLQRPCKAWRKLNKNFIANQKGKEVYHGLMVKSKLTADLTALEGWC